MWIGLNARAVVYASKSVLPRIHLNLTGRWDWARPSIPYPSSRSHKPVINAATCRYLREGKCRCVKRSAPSEPSTMSRKIVMSRRRWSDYRCGGVRSITSREICEYGYGAVPDVIDGLAFERLNSASGPTTGEIRRPSTGRFPRRWSLFSALDQEIAERYMPYCSRVCCMYTAKHAPSV